MSAADPPLVSIIIPVYNQRADFLRTCLDSAVSQDYGNIEIIISDNHSTNKDCIEIIEEFAKNDSRVKVVRPDKFVPLIRNFNFGFKSSRGEYVTFLSSDDLFLEDLVSETMKPFLSIDKPLAFVYSNTAYFTSDPRNITHHVRKRKNGYYTPAEAFQFFIGGREGSFCGALFKRESYEKVGLMNEDLNYAGDLYMFMFQLKYGGVYFVDKTLGLVRHWEREEYTNRLSNHLKDIRLIYNAVLNDAELMKMANGNSKIVKDSKKSHFYPLIFSFPKIYKNREIKSEIKDEADKIMQTEYSHSFWVKMVLNNKKNILGSILSKFYFLPYKIKSLVGN
jgi:glycosyltransferase involved in cell wall biosynthesis